MHAKSIVLAGVAGVFLAVAPASAADLVVNGGFETGTFTGFTRFGDTSASGLAGNFPGIPAVSQSIRSYFGNTNGTVSGVYQDVATVLGQTYAVSFLFEYDGGVPGTATLSFGGVPLYAFASSRSAGFQTLTFNTVATSTLSRLTYAYTTGASNLNIDNFSVNAVGAPVPEPATWGMMLLGFGGLGYALRRRAKPGVRIRFA